MFSGWPVTIDRDQREGQRQRQREQDRDRVQPRLELRRQDQVHEYERQHEGDHEVLRRPGGLQGADVHLVLLAPLIVCGDLVTADEESQRFRGIRVADRSMT
jgi:hypothetical protein